MKYRIKKFEEKTPDRFIGQYKQHDIDIKREDDGCFYIIVRSPEGSYCYDGWWKPYWKATINEAIHEALVGAELINDDPVRRGG